MTLFRKGFAVVDQLDSIVSGQAVAGFHNYIFAAFLMDHSCSLFHFINVSYRRHICQVGGFQQVRRHDQRTLYKQFFNGGRCFRNHDAVDAFADHDRVDDDIF